MAADNHTTIVGNLRDGDTSFLRVNDAPPTY
jgi:hypothetical protein